MTVTVPGSRAGTADEQSARNAESHRALVADLKQKLAAVRLGGPERSRARHVERGKLLPRDRVDSLLDPGSPFLELSPLAAYGLYGDDAPAPGIITGIGRVTRPRVRDRRQRRDGQGRHLLPDDGQEAPARPGGRAAQPAAVRLPGRLGRRLPARARTRCSPTASTSAASSTTRRTMSARGHPADRRGAGLVHRGRRLRAGDERRGGDRPQPGHDLPGRPAAGEGGDRRGGHAPRSSAAATCTPASPGSPTTSPTTTRTRCAIVRAIVATLGPRAPRPWEVRPTEEPPADPDELYGVVPADPAPPTTCAR